MPVLLDPALTDACRRLTEHRRWSGRLRPRCAAGCGRWPCTSFSLALEELLRSSWLARQTEVPVVPVAGPGAGPADP